MYEFSKRMPMLHQISSGLQVFGILDSIKEHPQLLEPVFIESSFFKPNADTFIDNIVGSFSEDGSNDKLIEIDVFKYFTDFIEECECSSKCMINKNIQSNIKYPSPLQSLFTQCLQKREGRYSLNKFHVLFTL